MAQGLAYIGPGSMGGTLSGLDALTLAEAERKRQEEELAARTLAATQEAQAAAGSYQELAQAPPPQLSPFEQLIPALFGNVASVLAQTPSYAETGQQQIQQSKATLLQARADNLKSGLEVWRQKAEAAQRAGDFEAEAKARTTLERQHRLLDEVEKLRERAFTSEQNQKDREAAMARTLAAGQNRGYGATGAGFDAASVAQGILEGTVPPDPSGFSRGQWGQIVGQGRKIDPKFNFMKAGLDYQGVRRFVHTLNQGQQVQLRQRAQNAMVTAGFIRELMTEIKANAPPRTPVTAINRQQLNLIKNGAWGPQAADAATKLEAQIAAWRLEMAAVYSGGYAPQEAHINEAQRLIDPNWSLNRIESGILVGERDTNIRLQAVNEVGAMSPSNPLIPGAAPTGGVNIGPNVMPFGTQAPTLTTVTYKGKDYHFPDPAKAETFKKRLGIK